MAKKTKNSNRSQIFVFKSKRLLFLSIAILVLLVPIVVFAQTKSVRTKVGTPREGDTIKIARDLKSAYDACNGSFTFENAVGNLASCLKEQLASMGYDENAQNLFESIRPLTLASYNGSAPCTQCLGFVRLVVALESGDPNALGGGAFGFASDVANISSFTAGSQTWAKIPEGDDPQPGDIAAHGRNGAGHIMIVAEVSGSRLTTIESNGQAPNIVCKATDNLPRIDDGLVYFRKM